MLPFSIFSRESSNRFPLLSTLFLHSFFTEILLCAKLPYSVVEFTDVTSNLLERGALLSGRICWYFRGNCSHLPWFYQTTRCHIP